jgi:hypothetical protein
MINGSANLDAAILSLEKILEIVREEKSSVDYARANAPLLGRILTDHLQIYEANEFSQSIHESTAESRENVDKLFTALNIISELLEHYVDLAEIGHTWECVINKNVETLRCYQ